MNHDRLKQVSILVVLDWVFKPADRLVRAAVRLRFNPCCIGLGIQTRSKNQNDFMLSGFNPCCIGLGIQTMADGIVGSELPVSILVVLDWVFKQSDLASMLESEY